MVADIQVAGSSGAVVANLYARCATGRIIPEQNRTARARTGVSNQRRATCVRGIEELQAAAGCAGDKAGGIGEGAIVCGRGVVEIYVAGARCAGGGNGGTVIGERAIVCGRAIEKPHGAAECAQHAGAVIGKCAIVRTGGVEEIGTTPESAAECAGLVREKPAARGCAVVKTCGAALCAAGHLAAVIDEAAIACGRCIVK